MMTTPADSSPIVPDLKSGNPTGGPRGAHHLADSELDAALAELEALLRDIIAEFDRRSGR
jgi:hypothetical protein